MKTLLITTLLIVGLVAPTALAEIRLGGKS